jgi:hypothetical protein
MGKRIGAIRVSRQFVLAAVFGLMLTPLAPDAGSHAETHINSRIATAHALVQAH